MYKIMIVEDDVKIKDELKSFLNKNGYESYSNIGFENVVEQVLAYQPDLLLLDLNLPIYDGYYLCREIRKQSDIPIIIVTSRDSEIDELMSMNLGADDFVSKPYNLQILLARIERLLKRIYEKETANILSVNNITLDMSKNVLTHQNKNIELTKNEFRILYYLFVNKDKIVTRDELMNYMWNSDLFMDDNTLTVNINRLRKKLEQVDLPELIQTKRGLGYIVYED